MDLTLHRPENTYFIRSFNKSGIMVTDTLYPDSLVLSGEHLVDDWPVNAVGELTETNLEPVFELKPEVVLLGTGTRQVFPDPKLAMTFYERDIGFEVMTTEAACRTFNVLLSENRKVVAALIQDAPDSHP